MHDFLGKCEQKCLFLPPLSLPPLMNHALDFGGTHIHSNGTLGCCCCCSTCIFSSSICCSVNLLWTFCSGFFPSRKSNSSAWFPKRRLHLKSLTCNRSLLLFKERPALRVCSSDRRKEGCCTPLMVLWKVAFLEGPQMQAGILADLAKRSWFLLNFNQLDVEEVTGSNALVKIRKTVWQCCNASSTSFMHVCRVTPPASHKRSRMWLPSCLNESHPPPCGECFWLEI